MNQKSFSSILLIGLVLSTLSIIGYFVFNKKLSVSNQGQTSSYESLVLTWTPGDRPFVQINFDWSRANRFNIYRSTNVDEEMKKIISDFPASAHTAVDYDIPKGATKLYYKVAAVDDQGQEISVSVITSVSVNEIGSQSESETIVSLKSNWLSIQSLISFRPTYHNQDENAKGVWRMPDAIQFIGNNNLLLDFGDDNNVHLAVLSFDNGKFKILETFKNQANFTLSAWQALVKKYGSSSYSISTYTTGLVRNKEIVSFDELKKVPENVFIKNYWELNNSTVYENQYMKITIPAGWTVVQGTKKVYTNGDSNNSFTIQLNPAAVNITKGNYILYINAQTSQTSGAEGGRLYEISKGAPSADAVLIDPPNTPCGSVGTYPAFNEVRNDLFIGPGDNKDTPWCAVPSNGKIVWYFSYIASDYGGYFNHYKNPINPEMAQYVITMAYNSKDVNLLPVKGSASLNTALFEMTNIVNTLELKQK